MFFLLDVREESFRMRVVRHWKRLPREAMDVPSLEGQAGREPCAAPSSEKYPAHNSRVGLDDLQGSIST